MGAYYHYVNFSKKERFSVDSLGGGSKLGAIGYTLGSRAFHLMLVEMTGRWAGDKIAILGDDHSPIWDEVYSDFIEIDANVIMTVFMEDGFDELKEYALEDTDFLMQLCYMADSKQALELESDLQSICSGSYKERYAELCKVNYKFRPLDIIPIPDKP